MPGLISSTPGRQCFALSCTKIYTNVQLYDIHEHLSFFRGEELNPITPGVGGGDPHGLPAS